VARPGWLGLAGPSPKKNYDGLGPFKKIKIKRKGKKIKNVYAQIKMM
jgi:hypothetical protein